MNLQDFLASLSDEEFIQVAQQATAGPSPADPANATPAASPPAGGIPQRAAQMGPGAAPYEPEAGLFGYAPGEFGARLMAAGEALGSVTSLDRPDMTAAMDRIDRIGASNRTAKWLAASGRPDLARAVESGAMTGRDAAGIMFGGAEDRRTALIKNYEYAAQNGYRGSFQDFLRDQGQGTNVTIKNEGNIPAGYRVVRDAQGNAVQIEPIPGSPAAREAAQETRRQAQSGALQEYNSQRLSREVARAVDLASKDYATGAYANLAALPIPSQARDLANAVQTLQANLGFDQLQTMREASPTGGALGQVSNMEIGRLESVVRQLDPTAGRETLKDALYAIEAHTNNVAMINRAARDGREISPDDLLKPSDIKARYEGGLGVDDLVDMYAD